MFLSTFEAYTPRDGELQMEFCRRSIRRFHPIGSITKKLRSYYSPILAIIVL